MRRSLVALATSIPRHVWDPSRHNPNWADSYATDIADRRHWPAKKWSIGLEPQTPDDWRQHSLRNLAYAYNGALRSCTTFPEMIRYYQEMKQRGVKVDMDTMNTLLTRAARYEKIQVEDVFDLYDELISLGARPDIATAETLHTVWEHATNAKNEWRVVRREQLIRTYHLLAETDIDAYATRDVPQLLSAQIKRYRDNLRSLGAALSADTTRRYMATIVSFDSLLHEVHEFLWSLVPDDHPAQDVAVLNMRVPVLQSTGLVRPTSETAPTATLSDYQDLEVNRVLLTAIERIVDHPMNFSSDTQRRAATLSLQMILSASQVLPTADVYAQLMEIVKFSPLEASRDRDAMRLLTSAVNGSFSGRKQSGVVVQRWKALATPCDARVVGRYLAARNAWDSRRFCPHKGEYSLFPAGHVAAASDANAVALPTTESSVGDSLAASNTGGDESKQMMMTVRTAADVDARWDDVQRLVQMTGAMSENHPAAHRLEVFSGQAIFLRHLFTDNRIGATATESKRSFASGMTREVCERIFHLVKSLKHELDVFCHTYQLAPEVECWESFVIVLREMLDFNVMDKRARPSAASTAATEPSDSEALFAAIAEFRAQLLDESRNRFDGKFRILWLQES